MADGLNEQKFTLDQAKQAGLISDYAPTFLGKSIVKYGNEQLAKMKGASPDKLLPQSFYVDVFKEFIGAVNKNIDWLYIPQEYKNSQAATDRFFANISQGIKNEGQRETGKMEATSKRARRAAGGLLAGASSPNLGQGGGASGPMLGDQAPLGDSSSLGMRRVL
jgi:hypothetical protein